MNNKTAHFCDSSIVEYYKEHIRSADHPMLILCKNNDHAERVAHTLECLSDANAIIIPENETLPYDEEFPQDKIISQRFAAIWELKNSRKKTDVFVVTIRAISERLLSSIFYHPITSISNNGDVDVASITNTLRENGYREEQTVGRHGDFSINPNTLDIYAYGANLPVRIYLKRHIDKNNTMFFFDPEKKTNIEICESLNVFPTREFPFNEKSINHFKFRYRQTFDCFKNDFFESIKNHVPPRGIDYYKSLFTSELSNLFDFFPSTTRVVSLINWEAESNELNASFKARYDEVIGHRNILEASEIIASSDEIRERINCLNHTQVTPAQNRKKELLENDVKKQEKIHETFKLIESAHKKTQKTLITINSETRLKQLDMMFKMKGKSFEEVAAWEDFLTKEKGFYVLKIDLDFGYINLKDGFSLITEFEIFDSKTLEESISDEDASERKIIELRVGDPVVHAKYGVGRFQGFKTFDDTNSEKEYAVINYAEDASIWVSLDEMNLISEYKGIDPENIPLDNASSKNWNKHLLAAVNDVKQMAHKLLEIKAKRQAIKREPYNVPAFEYRKFANEFPFAITVDQGKAIKNIIDDMQSDIAMDRLVVGDVGYGKTEVAMRAAMIAAWNKKQCCILAPTTLLAEQHYESFIERFSGMNFKIRLLTRESKQESKNIIRELGDGEIDIVIGTHRLIQKDVEFANLGLMVVDEEHRFGVKQKEDISKKRGNVDILSLSATPIPRTLSMTMHGIRDISTIKTAPLKRLAIRTKSSEYNKEEIVDAIRREIGRNGQAFYIFNDTENIDDKCLTIRSLFPDAKVEYAHGKMKEKDLQSVMQRFRSHDFDILLATTVIETGIDIPNANTIIIEQAENFGLSQLHQLRGRVGRSNKQAYAYLMTSKGISLNEKAGKRMKAMVENSNIGGGFKISNADLEIRGAGEVLGESQSGHIQEIGYQMYFSLLRKAMDLLNKGRKLDELSGDGNHLVFYVPYSHRIPASYVDDKGLKAAYYKAIVEIEDNIERSLLAKEMEHRFGIIPQSVADLMELSLAKSELANTSLREVKLSKRTIEAKFLNGSVTQQFLERCSTNNIAALEVEDDLVTMPFHSFDRDGVIDYVKIKDILQ